MPPAVEQQFAQARELEASGRRDEARRVIQAILETDPDHPGALQRVAEEELRSGALESARARFERALPAARARGLPAVELWFGLARVHTLRRDAAAARHAFENMLEEAPGDPRALLGMASLALGEGDAARAEAHARSAVTRNPDLAHAWTTLALALNLQQRKEEALDCARRGCEIAPQSIAIRRSYAAIALEQGDAATSIAVCRAGLEVHPNDVGLKCSLGDALSAAGALTEARDLLAPIVGSPHANAETWLSFGALCMAQGQSEEAVHHLRKAIEAGLVVARAWYLLGIAYRRLKRLEDAVTALERAIALEPRLAPALSYLCLALRETCRWDEADRAEQRWLASLDDPQSDPRRNPFIALALPTTPQQQLLVARGWSAHALPRVAAPAFIASRGTRLRVGYLTADFRAHPIAYLTAGLFECHDRSRLETFAYSYGPDDRSAIRRRVHSAFEHWRDAGQSSDDAFAHRIRADAIDVLVDLSGHTGDRLGIAARRPAPLQIHYLGLPRDPGLRRDRCDRRRFRDRPARRRALVPRAPAAAAALLHGHRQPARTPAAPAAGDTGPAGERRRARVLQPGVQADAHVLRDLVRDPAGTRARGAVALPARSRHPGAPAGRGHALQRRAGAHRVRGPGRPGIASGAAAGRRPRAGRAAVRLAHDGQRCAVGRRADAVVSGETFAGRVGASLLEAVGLSELATGSLAEYRSALSELVRDRDRLAGYKARLNAERPNLSLFDTGGFTRDFEAMLEAAANSA